MVTVHSLCIQIHIAKFYFQRYEVPSFTKDGALITFVRTPQGRSVARLYFSWGTGLVSIDTARWPTQSEAAAR